MVNTRYCVWWNPAFRYKPPWQYITPYNAHNRILSKTYKYTKINFYINQLEYILIICYELNFIEHKIKCNTIKKRLCRFFLINGTTICPLKFKWQIYKCTHYNHSSMLKSSLFMTFTLRMVVGSNAC